MTKFHLTNFGCRASQADGAALKRQLLDAGLAEAASRDESEIAVLNTCTVTATADAEVRQIIRRIHRANPDCRILVTGCYAQRAAEEIAKLPGVAWVVGNSHKHTIADMVKKDSQVRIRDPAEQKTEGGSQKAEGGSPNSEFRILNSQSLKAIPAPRLLTPDSRPTVLVGEITEEFHFAPVLADDHTRPMLKVQDGCDARCSFCIIPEVRGASRSMAPEKVIEQVRELEQQGYKEIVLSGINLGSYGKDLDRRITFLGLVERILSDTGIPRIRISSIELMDVSPALISLVAREPRMARHFHVPLQSGSDRILRAMNRRYWTRHYADRIQAIHQQIPNCGIGADVMVGFPGETEEDHATSVRFIESIPFTYLHVFPYSSRPGTAAAVRHDHLNGRIIHDRGQEMRAVMKLKRAAFLETQIGRILPSVTLDEEQDGERVALSSNYLKLVLPGTETPANVLLEARVGRVHGGVLYAFAESRVGEPSGLRREREALLYKA